ncbi:hypothetical protein [Paenibacillus xylanexedens]|uniref:hypothetical protein n=1 Tax=Paenibacillus xylanexedens TaxID=528191 RepID=UPI00119D663F|nr:hypothetical protein [Paenibacillus xylanexedens]
MKSFVKKLFTCLLAVSFLSSTSSIAFGAESVNLNTDQLDAYLVENGYPSTLIEVLEQEQKQDLYDQKAVYTSHYVASSTVNENSENNIESSEEGNVSALSLSNFTHVISLSQVATTSGKVDFQVNYNWDWNYGPTYTFEDQWGLAWSDDFDAVPSSAKYSYKAFGHCPLCGSSGKYAETQGTSKTGYKKYTPGAGIGFSANLINGFTGSDGNLYGVYRHKGWSGFKITKPHDGSGRIDSSSMVAQYFHKYLTLNGELSFSGGAVPDVGISASTAYDQSNDEGHQWNWYHKNK